MESGYSFLHPRNVWQKPFFDSNDDYKGIPFSIWRPCVPFVERLIPPTGLVTWVFRLLRLTWVLGLIPTWIGFVLLMELVKLPDNLLPPTLLPRRPSWSLLQKLTYPLLSRVIWAITFGLPPAASPLDEEGITFPARVWYGRRTHMLPVDLSFQNSEEEKEWIQGDAIDPAGTILPQKKLPGFWITRTQPPIPPSTKEENNSVEVVYYIVGGGYITGHPLEASRVFDIARLSGKRVLGVNYRKAVSAENAFPAALQDMISGYAYLVREGYTRIALAGDSAGAGLAVALLQYLSRLTEGERRPPKLIMPVKALLNSPWVDLTFSHAYGDNVHFDIIHPTMLAFAVAGYTNNLASYSKGNAQQAADSVGTLKRAHPYFSPALESAVPSLRRIVSASKQLRQEAPCFLIFHGTVELFAAECRSLASNLRKAGMLVEEYRGNDETHGFFLVPALMSKNIPPALQKLADWLQ